MAATVLVTGHGPSVGAGLTRYVLPGLANPALEATEANAELRWRSAGTLSDLFVRIRTNNRGPSTITLRINGGAGNQSVAIGDSATGVFEDADTDAIVATDDTAYEIVTGAGGTAFSCSMISSLFAADTNTVTKFSASEGAFAGDNFTIFPGVVGIAFATLTEDETSVLLNAGGTLENLSVFVESNSRTTTCTIGSRVNEAAGNLSVSVTSTATGLFEDTSGSDTLVADDRINSFLTTLGSGGTIQWTWAAELTSTDGTFHLGTRNDSGIADPNIRFSSIGGIYNRSNSSTDFNMVLRRAALVSNLTSFHFQNSLNAATTVAFQVNDTDELSYSVPATTTGRFEDSASFNVLATDDVRHRIDASASSSGSIDPGPVVVMMGPAAAPEPAAATPMPVHNFGLVAPARGGRAY